MSERSLKNCRAESFGIRESQEKQSPDTALTKSLIHQDANPEPRYRLKRPRGSRLLAEL